jgi:hypothetical protein
MSSLDIAPHPEGAPARVRDRRRMRRRFRVSFRRAGICTIWRLGFRQFSFHHIARVPRRTVPDTWTRPPVSCHALVPLTFRRQVRHQTHGHPSNPSRLRRGYNEAPRGAPLICRVEGRPPAYPGNAMASKAEAEVSSLARACGACPGSSGIATCSVTYVIHHASGGRQWTPGAAYSGMTSRRT